MMLLAPCRVSAGTKMLFGCWHENAFRVLAWRCLKGTMFPALALPPFHIEKKKKKKEQLFLQPHFGVILMSISGQFFPCL